MALAGDMSQEEILDLIQSQKSRRTGSYKKSLEEESESEDEDLLEPSTQNRTSNRTGGGESY
jgi:hypothetical protein